LASDVELPDELDEELEALRLWAFRVGDEEREEPDEIDLEPLDALEESLELPDEPIAWTK
jgi:hypothetical protein